MSLMYHVSCNITWYMWYRASHHPTNGPADISGSKTCMLSCEAKAQQWVRPVLWQEAIRSKPLQKQDGVEAVEISSSRAFVDVHIVGDVWQSQDVWISSLDQRWHLSTHPCERHQENTSESKTCTVTYLVWISYLPTTLCTSPGKECKAVMPCVIVPQSSCIGNRSLLQPEIRSAKIRWLGPTVWNTQPFIPWLQSTTNQGKFDWLIQCQYFSFDFQGWSSLVVLGPCLNQMQASLSTLVTMPSQSKTMKSKQPWLEITGSCDILYRHFGIWPEPFLNGDSIQHQRQLPWLQLS